MEAADSIFYKKAILAPMVRVCSPGFRALCAAHGADVVFTEEVVAAKLASCQREVVRYPTVDTPMAEYVSYDAFKNAYKRTVVLSTPARAGAAGPSNAPRVVLQLGVADPVRGAAAALVGSEDVDGVDLNMGCPKKFSVQNGFGVALMRRPEVAGAIVRAVHDAVNSEDAVSARGGRRIAVSLKTRLKDTTEATVAMLKAMVTAAQHTAAHPVLHAITLHARTPDQRSETAPLYERAAEVAQALRADVAFGGICLVLNGSVLSRQDGEAKCAQYGFDSAMIARAALEDARCFHDTPVAPGADVQAHAMAIMKELFLYSVRYRSIFNNFKYHLTRAFPVVEALKPLMEEVQLDLRSYDDCCAFFRITPAERQLVESCAYTMELLPKKPAPPAKRSLASDATGVAEGERAAKHRRVEGAAEACA